MRTHAIVEMTVDVATIVVVVVMVAVAVLIVVAAVVVRVIEAWTGSNRMSSK